jgi:hypothetical protein
MSYRYSRLDTSGNLYDASGYEQLPPTGRRFGWDDAYDADGGANDEGYNYRHCRSCRKSTEHDLNECLSCGNDN